MDENRQNVGEVWVRNDRNIIYIIYTEMQILRKFVMAKPCHETQTEGGPQNNALVSP